MNKYKIISPVAQYLPKDGQWWLCPQSKLALDIEYEKDDVLLPLSKKPSLTLGEGTTPLLKLSNLSKKVGFELWAKCEFLNPTGSFKDRGSVVEISKAVELGKNGIVCASTGNMAASLSAYAAKTNLECIVVVPAKTPESKLQQALVCGAKLKKVKGSYDECVSVAEKIAKDKDYFLCGDYVIRREGQKTIGWELAQSKVNIDSIVVPVGNGTLGVAVMKGFDEKRNNQKLPKFIGIQAENANPLEIAWENNQEIQPMQNTQTIASAFNVGNPLDGYLVLDWINKSKGSLLTVSDEEIVEAQESLATQEGFFVETTAATTLAGILKTKERFKNQSVVIVLTGSGLKERR